MNIVSFYAPRPDHPRFGFCDYVQLLGILQRSCDRLGLRHIVLTDSADLPFETFARPLPGPLMRAVVVAQHAWVAEGDWLNGDTLLVGADCVILRDPAQALAQVRDMAVTYRPGHRRYPINTGMILVRQAARGRAERLFRRVAERTGETWGDDQRAIAAALEPLPPGHGAQFRAGMQVDFLPMKHFNQVPGSPADPMRGATIAHFRGRQDRKQLMVDWAARNLPC